MHDMLKEIIEQKRIEVANLQEYKKDILSAYRMRKPKDFKKTLTKPGLSFISEIKRRSPSKGQMADISDPEELLYKYVENGTDAVSVLTDGNFFAGNIEDCANVSDALSESEVAVLRKDFIIDELQVLQSIAAGADATLLIMRVLKRKTMDFINLAKELGITAIVEVHDIEELHDAIVMGAEVIGVNNRNLDTFETDIDTCIKLAEYIPSNYIKIAESGIHTEEDIKRIKEAGYDAVLIGEALVTADDPGVKLRQLRAVK